MNIRIPFDLLQYLDSVRGEKSRQAYLVGLLDEDKSTKGEQKVIESVLKKDFKSL